MTYSVVTTRRADREITRLAPRIRRQVLEKMLSLSNNPRPQDIKTLRGRERSFRVDSGEYRVLFEIDDPERVVTIFRVGHRREVYRNLP